MTRGFFPYTYFCLSLHFHYFATLSLDSKFLMFVRRGITRFCWFDDVDIQSRSNFVQLLFFCWNTKYVHIFVVIIHFLLVFGVLVMVNDAMFCACHDVNCYICQWTHLISVGVVLICVWEMLGQINIFEILISIFNMQAQQWDAFCKNNHHCNLKVLLIILGCKINFGMP
jgi:hypothetical protein